MAKANQEWIFLEFVLWGAMAGMKSHIAPRVGFSPHTKLICCGGLFGSSVAGSRACAAFTSHGSRCG